MSDLSSLREQVLARDSRCVWPECVDGPLELVHLRHRGMGGSVVRNTPENCVMMCRIHHSIYDGRIVGATARSEWARLFQYLAGVKGERR